MNKSTSHKFPSSGIRYASLGTSFQNQESQRRNMLLPSSPKAPNRQRQTTQMPLNTKRLITPYHYQALKCRLRSQYSVGHCSKSSTCDLQVSYKEGSEQKHERIRPNHVPRLDEMGYGKQYPQDDADSPHNNIGNTKEGIPTTRNCPS